MSQNAETEELDKAQAQDISLVTGPVNRLENPTDREQSTIVRGQEAWQRLSQNRSWEDWKHLGAAIVIGRNWAMREAAVNQPVGRRYNVLFAGWLAQFGFENLDKADRSRLFAAMDHLEEIDAWRASLTPTERLRLNHPSAVFRKWKSANAISRNLSPSQRPQSLRWDPADRPEDIATAMLAMLSRDKAVAVAGAILKALGSCRSSA
jgi:hypothetical protein